MTDKATDDDRAQSFLDAYETHDVAEQWLGAKLVRHGYEVEPLGIDRRTEDLDDLSVRPDRRVARNGSVCGYLEPKSKSLDHAEWFGRLNYRHFKKYVEFAEAVEEPVVLYFAVVDDDDMVVREDFCPVYSMDQIVETMVPNANPNTVVQLDERDMRSWPWLFHTLER